MESKTPMQVTSVVMSTAVLWSMVLFSCETFIIVAELSLKWGHWRCVSGHDFKVYVALVIIFHHFMSFWCLSVFRMCSIVA